jgi:uncharacterized membrane-anchored protein
MLLRDLLHDIGVDADRAGAALDDGRLERPWYVHVALSLLLWSGAISLMGAIAAFDLLDHVVVQAVAGGAFFALAIVASRCTQGLVRLNLALLGYAGTTVFLFAFFEEVLDLQPKATLAANLVVQAVVLFSVRARPVRFKASIGLWIASFWLLVFELRIDGAVYVTAVAVVVVVCFAFDAFFTARGLDVVVRPLGFASALALILASLWVHEHPHRASFVGVGAVLLVVGVGAGRRSALPLAARVTLFAGAGVLLVLVHERPAIVSAVLLLVLGRMRGERILEVGGFVSAGVFLFLLYHDLELSLLWTSFALAGTGALLLVVRLVLLSGASPSATSLSTSMATTTSGSVFSPRYALPAPRLRPALLVPMIAVVAITLGLVVDKEQLRAHGDTLFVELARSHLQGDYLRLGYRHTEAAEVIGSKAGVFIVDLDARGVVTAAAIANDAAPGPHQHRLRYHRHTWEVVFGAPTYFIPEGTGGGLAAARYAEFRVDVDGTPLLVGLRDAELQTLHLTD